MEEEFYRFINTSKKITEKVMSDGDPSSIMKNCITVISSLFNT